MAGKRLPARFSLRSQLWFRGTGKCFETATSHMQTVVSKLKPAAQTAHLVFLPTHNPTLKKPKELFFANARRKIEQNTENRK